jgi:hypothetical protein
MQDKIIKISKLKILGLVGLSLLFVLLGMWLAFYAPFSNVEFLNNPLLRKSIGLLSVIFFGLMGALLSKKLFENTYGLKITDEGIYDHSTSIHSGLIRWENIEHIELNKVFNQKFIRIKVNNPQDFIERQKNILRRKNVEVNFKTYGSPIQISANALKIGCNELYDLLVEEMNKRK